ncbi:MAG: DUF2240 family protein [Methanosarcinales archaeon]|nr:MAG: DUF2240 family protein [Methanosarcinales archaeon]
MTLKQVVTYVFRRKGGVIPISEFVFALSLDLKWFSPDQAESVLKSAEKNELVKITEDLVEPLFDIGAIEVPIDFRPDQSILEEKTLTIFDQVVERLSTVKSKPEIIRMINEEQECLRIVEPDAVALLIARKLGVDVADLIDGAYQQLIR